MGKVLTLRKVRPTFWESYRWTWRDAVAADKSLTPFARLIAVLLATKFANAKTGKCYPGLQAIMASVSGPKSSTLRALAQLEDAGWIKKVVPNAPFRNAEYAFTRPGRVPPVGPEQVPPVGPEQVPSVVRTGPNPENSPTPPYKEQHTMEHNASPDWLENIGGQQPPDFVTKLVPFGSPLAETWDAWLASEGYPALAEIGIEQDGHWVMPMTVPANKYDKLPRNIAVQWAKYMLGRKR